MEWPLLLCVACHDLVQVIEALYQVDICTLQLVRREAKRDAGLSRAERGPELSFHECMEWPLLSFFAGDDLVGAIEELHRIDRLPEVPRLAKRDAEPSFRELMRWLLRPRQAHIHLVQAVGNLIYILVVRRRAERDAKPCVTQKKE